MDKCERCGLESAHHDCFVEGRQLVSCDDPACLAYDLPETCDEMENALKHWRFHSYTWGCSHGR